MKTTRRTSLESMTMDEDRCWHAVMARDRRSDGAFVYAVRSTGIYCRPSCPSRRPHRRQVVFFPLPEAAERAGFRPCRRCRPREVAGHDPHVELTRQACRAIEAHDEGPLSLSVLGAQVGVSPHYLQRVFKRVMGITPRQYAEAWRLRRLKARLKERDTVATAQYAAGYGSSSRLYERAHAQLGMTPATYRRRGHGVRVGYTIVESALGRLLVAATGRGVCFISLGDSDAALETALVAEYPGAEIRRDESGLTPWVGAVVGYLGGQTPHLDLPLDVRATAFQWRVWQELRTIPTGTTRTYGEIARALGRPTAARAVARAVATNPVAVVIPCHRVVREDGGLGGYRWGVERKRTLLARERAAARPRGRDSSRGRDSPRDQDSSRG
ncbi:MAG: bifunctional DNA-binding transcriptional regulator/O6-methylguanine-DNA methyltransferase Ada [Armatimonadetes bacterium]|nr:bifunctional DNA-binding transcriptional regulator/O6-methylguanine-DNA methyltransferase Ada [Armatimonadota bacterium]